MRSETNKLRMSILADTHMIRKKKGNGYRVGNRTSLATGRINSPCDVRTRATRTMPSLPGRTSKICPRRHEVGGP